MVAVGEPAGQVSRPFESTAETVSHPVDVAATSSSNAWLRACAAASFLPALLYLPALGFGFVFDDLSLIDANGPAFLGTDWLAYRPVRHLSHLFDAAMGRGAPWAYHLNNILLHVIVCCSTLGVARRLGYAPVAGLVAALVVGFHPLAVEAVAHVSGRRDLLAAALGIAGLLVWIAPRQGPDRRYTRYMRYTHYVSVLLILASVGAKESGLVFLPVLAMASAVGLGPRCTVSFGVLVAAAVASACLVAAYGGAGPLLQGLRVADAGSALALGGHYLAGIGVMRPLSLVYPDLLGLPGGVVPTALASAAVVSLCFLGAIGLSRSTLDHLSHARRRVKFLAAWALIALASIVFGAGLHEPGADRHAYPLLPVVALLACGSLGSAASGARTAKLAVAAVALVWLGLGSAERMQVWRSPATLWAATVHDAPGSARAHHNLAGVYVDQGRIGKARRHLARSIRIDEGYAPAYLGLAHISCSTGHVAKAGAHLSAARLRGATPAEIDEVASSCVLNLDQ